MVGRGGQDGGWWEEWVPVPALALIHPVASGKDTSFVLGLSFSICKMGDEGS